MTTPFQLIHVLVVEDDASQCALMLAHLERLGVRHYHFANDGQDAIDRLKRELFHVVLTDNTMPGSMSGRELIMAIRSDSLIRHLKIAMISGELTKNGSEEDAELRDFLWRHNVLPISKAEIDNRTIGRAIQALVGF